MSILTRTHTRHVAMQLIAGDRISSNLVTLRDTKRRYVLKNGVIGGPLARAVRELVEAGLAEEKRVARVMAGRLVRLNAAGEQLHADWNKLFGKVEVSL